MEIYGLEKLSLVDYSNYACAVVFTGGCNFRCPFCHNSGLVDKDVNCLNTGEVLEFLRNRYGLLDAVCVSGGEPTLQPDLLEFLAKIKDIGYKIKLDTNGTNPTLLKSAIEKGLIDYVAMDIKNSYEKYPLTTGLKTLNLENIKESIDILKQGKVDYEFRTTLVKEFHDIEDIKGIAILLKGVKRLYLQRFVNSPNCISRELNPIDKDTANKWKDILSKSILDVNLRGYV